MFFVSSASSRTMRDRTPLVDARRASRDRRIARTTTMTTPASEAPRSPLADVRANADDGGFMSHAPRPVKLRNVATHHPVVRRGPTTGVEAIMRGDENAPCARRARRAWNENRAAQHEGANLFKAEAPGRGASAAGTRITNANGKLASVDARYDVVSAKTLTLQELRQACRARGVNPGGSKDALVERLEEAVAAGAQPLTLDSRPTTQRSAVGAGARFSSKAVEVCAPVAVASAQRQLRESQAIWRKQQSGNDIFGTNFVDAAAKKRKVVEGPKTTFSFDAISQSFVETTTEANAEPEAIVENASPKRAKTETAATTAPTAAASNPIVQSAEPVASKDVTALAGHRKSAWSSFHGAGIFSEAWTTAAEEENVEETLVKSTTATDGAWTSLDDKDERDEDITASPIAEQDEEDEDEDEDEEERLEREAQREADEAVAAAERELAAELAAESDA